VGRDAIRDVLATGVLDEDDRADGPLVGERKHGADFQVPKVAGGPLLTVVPSPGGGEFRYLVEVHGELFSQMP
jgi:hypothetical protein